MVPRYLGSWAERGRVPELERFINFWVGAYPRLGEREGYFPGGSCSEEGVNLFAAPTYCFGQAASG